MQNNILNIKVQPSAPPLVDTPVSIFNNPEFGNVRVVTGADGSPWFVAKDVCEAFGDSSYRRSLSRLDDDEKGVSQIDTPGGRQEMSVVNEAGLYSLLFYMQPQKGRGVTEDFIQARQGQLKAFKRWVTHEILPSIRQHGIYATQQTVEAMLADPDTAITLLQTLKEERQKSAALEAQAALDRPKVVFAEAVSVTESTILTRELAKLIKQDTGFNIGGERLFEWMRENGYLIRQNGKDRNMPTQRSMDLGLFVIKEGVFQHPDKGPQLTKTPRVTGKGQIYFVNKFRQILENNGGAA